MQTFLSVSLGLKSIQAFVDEGIAYSP